MATWICLALAVVMIAEGAKEIVTMVQLRQSISETEAKTTELKKKEKKLKTTKKNLSDPSYIEYIARGKYLVTKDGEQVFKFPDEN